jgi:hypothetical protein
MEIKKQIQKLVEIGFTKENLSKQSPKQINTLYESMVNAHGFVGYGKMDKPIGRMETKEQTGKVTMKEPDAGKIKALTDKGINVELGETKSKKRKKKEVEKNPWAICTSSLGLEGKKKDDYTKGQDKKFERCVLDVKKSLKEGKNPYEVILERKMRDIIEENLRPTMTKKDLINSILESKTKEKTKEKEKTTTPTKKNPFQPAPNSDPKPKGSGTKEKEKTKEKERTTTNPRKNPFQPAPNTDPRPKGELPSYLSFGKMNIKLKGE